MPREEDADTLKVFTALILLGAAIRSNLESSDGARAARVAAAAVLELRQAEAKLAAEKK